MAFLGYTFFRNNEVLLFNSQPNSLLFTIDYPAVTTLLNTKRSYYRQSTINVYNPPSLSRIYLLL